MADRRRDAAEKEVGNPRRPQGVADQGGFEDELGTPATGGGLDQGGLAAEGVRNGAPSERRLMINQRGRDVEDEAGYDELRDVHPGRDGDKPIVVDRDDKK